MTVAGRRALDLAFLRGVPNALTVSRMALAVAFPWIPEGPRRGLLAVALVTEFLDGFLARRFGWTTRLGQLLDPIADKLLFGMVVGTFLVEGRLSWIELGAIAIRDVAVLLQASWVSFRAKWATFAEMRPGILGKLTTALQYSVFFVLAFDVRLPPALTIATFVIGLGAAIRYGVLGLEALKRS